MTLKKSAYSELIIAIDGPAGAGKSTVALALANKLGLRYIDTGAMYRALAFKAQKYGIGPLEGQKAAELCAKSIITFGEGIPQAVLLDGEDISNQIRTLEIGELASALSAHPEVRSLLVTLQQKILRQGGATLEGRDVTTVVAPNARVKIFLTASLDERARRRFEELKAKGANITYEDVRSQIAERDQRDTTREASPLKIAEDAIVIDSETLDASGVVQKILELVEERGANSRWLENK